MKKPRQKRYLKKPQVLRLIAEGLTNQQIAEAMDMRPENVAAIRREASCVVDHQRSAALSLHQLALRCL